MAGGWRRPWLKNLLRVIRSNVNLSLQEILHRQAGWHRTRSRRRSRHRAPARDAPRGRVLTGRGFDLACRVPERRLGYRPDRVAVCPSSPVRAASAAHEAKSGSHAGQRCCPCRAGGSPGGAGRLPRGPATGRERASPRRPRSRVTRRAPGRGRPRRPLPSGSHRCDARLAACHPHHGMRKGPTMPRPPYLMLVIVTLVVAPLRGEALTVCEQVLSRLGSHLSDATCQESWTSPPPTRRPPPPTTRLRDCLRLPSLPRPIAP